MIFDKIISYFSVDMSIDLGTANTLIAIKNKGIIINEPSVVAVQQDKYGNSKVLAVGEKAKQMIGKTPLHIKAVRPMRDGVIADFDMTEHMIKYFINKAHQRSFLTRPRIIICIPHGITQVERKAVKDSAVSAGAGEVYLVEEPMAAAIGARIDVSGPKGNMVVDIGGGTTEIGITSLGGLVLAKSIKIAGDRFDRAIVDHIRQNFNLFIGDRTAEEIKQTVGTAHKLDKLLTTIVKGRDSSGLLSSIEFTSEDCREALKEPLRGLVLAVKQVLEQLPPDLAGDLLDNGIVITGGGALVRGIDRYIEQEVNIHTTITEEPLLAVAHGASTILDNFDLLRLISNE